VGISIFHQTTVLFDNTVSSEGKGIAYPQTAKNHCNRLHAEFMINFVLMTKNSVNEKIIHTFQIHKTILDFYSHEVSGT
jgi:hypothetical protein